jgi:hypothetical protein
MQRSRVRRSSRNQNLVCKGCKPVSTAINFAKAKSKSDCLSEFHHKLGSVRRDLEEVKAEGLLAGTIENLSALGYHYCFGLAADETLASITTPPLAAALRCVPRQRALVFQHCHAESAVLPWDRNDLSGASRNRYFPAAVMQQLQLDEVAYLCSFASGCAGFLSLLLTAGGLFSAKDEEPVVCVMADSRPKGVTFDMLRERILGSDHSSAFVLGREECGYQLLGLNYSSTTRTLVPLMEIVKRTVEMLRELAAQLDVNLSEKDIAIHYPNIFPKAWSMVTRYLQLPRVEQITDGMRDRAHCGATDSVISLGKVHRGERGRLHVVVNYGVGLHLGLCILEEQKS